MILTASQPVKATPAGRTRTHGRARRAPPCTWRKPKRVAAAAAAGGAVPPRPFQRVQTNVKQSAHINETLWPEAPVGGHAQKLDMEPVTLAAHNPGMMTEHSLDSKALVSAPRGSSPVPAAGSPARELGKRGPRPRRPREHARLVMQDEVLRGLSASGWPAAVEGGDQLPVGAEGSATASSFMQQLMRLSSLPAGSSVMGPQDATGYVERRLGCLCAGCTAQSAGCATRDQTDIHSPAAARGCGTSDRLTPPPRLRRDKGQSVTMPAAQGHPLASFLHTLLSPAASGGEGAAMPARRAHVVSTALPAAAQPHPGALGAVPQVSRCREADCL